MSDSAKLTLGLVVLIVGASALGYAVGSNGAPDKADAARARAEAQAEATSGAQKSAYDAALAKGKAAGQAEGTKAGRKEGGTDGFAAADEELAAERRKREKAQGDCLPFQAFVPGVGCFPPISPGDIPGDEGPGPGGPDGPHGPGNSGNAPGHQGDFGD